MERRKNYIGKEQDGNTRVMPAFDDRDSDLTHAQGRVARDAIAHEASEEDDDDELIAASPTLWSEHGRPARSPSARRARGEPEPEHTAEPRAKKTRGIGTWAAIMGLVFAGGGGLAFGIAALKGDPTTPEPTRATAPVAVASVPPAPEPTPPTPTRAPAPEPTAHVPEPTAHVPEPAASTPKPKPEPKPEPVPAKPPEWVAAVEASNPWVTIPAADRDRLLGVTVDALGTTYADRITGLWPDRRVMAPRTGYLLQRHEVTWAELESAAGSVGGVGALVRPRWVPSSAERRANLPATGVPWSMARAFCRTMGGDLPTEAHWEWAVRGPEDNYFPWGREAVDSNHVRIFVRRPIPLAAVGKSKQDVTNGTGLHDMLGNAQEWTRDVWTPGRTAGGGEATKLRVVRGWPLTARSADVPSEGSTYREGECADKGCTASDGAEHIGFRCMKSLGSN